tara:strand:- start:498 stop:1244 length:747 start_codon:yes stop_codon:yes gene_type:complete
LVSTQFGKTIKDNPLLTRRQEFDLAKKMQQGDMKARKKLIESNYRLVLSIAKKYYRDEFNFEDLVQESSIGLIKAVDKFNPDLGHKFSTYACWWIKQSALQYINENATNIKVPVHSRLLNAKILKAGRQFEEEQGHQPTIEELAALVDESPKKIKYTLKANKRTSSLEKNNNDENSNSNLLNKIEDDSIYVNPEKQLEFKELNKIIRESLKLLTSKEEKIIRLRFGIDEGINNIEDFPVTEEMMEYLG